MMMLMMTSSSGDVPRTDLKFEMLCELRTRTPRSPNDDRQVYSDTGRLLFSNQPMILPVLVGNQRSSACSYNSRAREDGEDSTIIWIIPGYIVG